MIRRQISRVLCSLTRLSAQKYLHCSLNISQNVIRIFRRKKYRFRGIISRDPIFSFVSSSSLSICDSRRTSRKKSVELMILWISYPINPVIEIFFEYYRAYVRKL